MEPDRWSRVQTLFHAARTVPPDDRDRFLDRRCGDHPSLRREVEALLQADAQDDAFLDTSPVASSWPERLDGLVCHLEPEVPDRIGKYDVIEEIGRGGMGTVYRAHRADGLLERQVAIKLIRRGLDTDDIVRRFRQEWQLLARLEHPNIARLYDAGITDAGRSYFVMEHVDGVPITEYAEAHALSVDDRLRLFQQVCAAVHFAHSRLVLHRDLKPGNILVTADPDSSRGQPQVKLLDFGLARVLSPDGLIPKHSLTVAARRMYTPQYASPEQVRGHTLTTASDVYGLGVVLYELLTGAPPYGSPDTSPATWERLICEEPVRPPSHAVRTRVDAPARSIKSDLDRLVCKTLEKAPEARYASVEQLGADVERYLHRQPLLAQPVTWRYWTRLLWRRAQPYLGVAALGTIALLLLIIVGLAYGPIDKNPVDYRLEGDYLRFLNANGQVVGTGLVEREMHNEMKSGDPDYRPAFADADGDGTNEIFWMQHEAPNQPVQSFVVAKKIGARKPLWKVPLRFDLAFPRKAGTSNPDFKGRALIAGDFDGNGRTEVITSVANKRSFPCLLLKIDAQSGEVLQRYVHPGWLEDLRALDLDGDGVQEILASGRNNAYFDQAALTVLDPRDMEGHAPLRGDYVVEGIVPAQHIGYVRFPPTLLSDTLLTDRVAESVRGGQTALSQHVALDIREGGYSHDPANKSFPLGYIVFLDENLTVADVNTKDTYDAAAAKLYRDGHLPFVPDYAYWQRWKEQVQYWTGDGWVAAAEWTAGRP
ncbi:MAG: protein kinase [Bacteroidetes bacterium]|jgi:serine/threonine protein kinase|nr:protein kinase [Bacteroidota bacterium]